MKHVRLKLMVLSCFNILHPFSTSSNQNKKGFTLIETIMVIVIVVILAAVVILRNPFSSIKLSSATRKVVADIRYVQKLSISNQTRAGMTFNANGYSVFRNITVPTAAQSPGDTCSTDASNNFVVNFTLSRCSSYSGVTLTFSSGTIAFNSLGNPVDAAGTALAAQTVTLSLAGAGSKTINIEAGTGRVSY